MSHIEKLCVALIPVPLSHSQFHMLHFSMVVLQCYSLHSKNFEKLTYFSKIIGFITLFLYSGVSVRELESSVQSAVNGIDQAK